MWKEAFLYFASEHLNWYNFMDLEISIKITNTHTLYSATSLRRIYPIETLAHMQNGISTRSYSAMSFILAKY